MISICVNCYLPFPATLSCSDGQLGSATPTGSANTVVNSCCHNCGLPIVVVGLRRLLSDLHRESIGLRRREGSRCQRLLEELLE